MVDNTGAALAYVYASEDRAGTSMSTALTRAEALAIARVILRLPDVR